MVQQLCVCGEYECLAAGSLEYKWGSRGGAHRQVRTNATVIYAEEGVEGFRQFVDPVVPGNSCAFQHKEHKPWSSASLCRQAPALEMQAPGLELTEDVCREHRANGYVFQLVTGSSSLCSVALFRQVCVPPHETHCSGRPRYVSSASMFCVNHTRCCLCGDRSVRDATCALSRRMRRCYC